MDTAICKLFTVKHIMVGRNTLYIKVWVYLPWVISWEGCNNPLHDHAEGQNANDQAHSKWNLHFVLDDVDGILSWKSKESPEIMKYLLIKVIVKIQRKT